MKVSMSLEGGAEVAARLRSISPRVAKRLEREALVEGGEVYAKRASRNAPRAPGKPDIAEHIGVNTVRSGPSKGVIVGPERGFFYGFFQEFGTVHHSAQPFMRPAFDTETMAVIRTIVESLRRELAARGVRQARVEAPTPVQSPGSLT